MAQNAETPRAESGAFPEDLAAGGSWPVAVTVQDATDDAQPGLSVDAFRVQWAHERARRAAVLDNIRQHLSEQPSNRAIRSCARRWADSVIRLADDVIAERQN